MLTIESDRLAAAFSVLFDAFYAPEEGLFREAIGAVKQGDRPFAYNWSFGALLAAFAAFLESGAADGHPRLSVWTSALAAANDRYLTFFAGRLGYDSYLGQSQPDRYYDDNAWIGLASLRIHERTRDAIWMQRAVTACEFVRSGWDRATDGVFWRETPRQSLHVCSAGPGALLAAELYRHTGEGALLGAARQWFAWTLGLRDLDGVFQDNVNPETGVVGPRKYTYNQGTPLHAALVLHKITGESDYHVEAGKILRATDYFVTGRDPFRAGLAEGELPRTVWFNAVLLRALTAAVRGGLRVGPQILAAFDRELTFAWETFQETRPLAAHAAQDDAPGRMSLLDAAGTMEQAALWLTAQPALQQMDRLHD